MERQSKELYHWMKENINNLMIWSRVGRPEGDVLPDIQLSGEAIKPEHCTFETNEGVVK